MARIKTASIPEQVATHLREGIVSGRWVGIMPGRDRLAAELAVSPRSLQVAMSILKKEGLLTPQGQGRHHVIHLPKETLKTAPIRVGILCLTKSGRGDDYMIELRHELEEAGHVPVMLDQGLQELGMNVQRVAEVVRATNAHAWVVLSSSHDILQWFADQGIHVFALAGRRFQLPIAGTGPEKSARYSEVVRHLAGLGHKLIVFLCLRHLRQPAPSRSARAFLEAMWDAGLATGDYNLPDWDQSLEGFQMILESLFKTTPPTALILDEAHLFHAAYHFLAQRNLRVPQDVSLVCSDGSRDFVWCKPSVAHIAWDYQPVVRRIIKWVGNVSRGVDDRRQSFTKAIYVHGGSVGPPPDR